MFQGRPLSLSLRFAAGGWGLGITNAQGQWVVSGMDFGQSVEVDGCVCVEAVDGRAVLDLAAE